MNINKEYELEYMENWEQYADNEDVCDELMIGSAVVEVRDMNGEFIGYCDPETMPIFDEVVEVVVSNEKQLSKRALTSTVAPWANQKIVKTVVDESEFPSLANPKPKIVKKKVEKKVVKKETNNIFDALAEDDKTIEPKKQKIVYQKMDMTPQVVEKIGRRTDVFKVMESKEKLVQKLEKTTMCSYGHKCGRKVCHFAHTVEELKPRSCLFGKDCKYFGKEKTCKFFHPHSEDKLAFLKRTTHTHTH